TLRKRTTAALARFNRESFTKRSNTLRPYINRSWRAALRLTGMKSNAVRTAHPRSKGIHGNIWKRTALAGSRSMNIYRLRDSKGPLRHKSQRIERVQANSI